MSGKQGRSIKKNICSSTEPGEELVWDPLPLPTYSEWQKDLETHNQGNESIVIIEPPNELKEVSNNIVQQPSISSTQIGNGDPSVDFQVQERDLVKCIKRASQLCPSASSVWSARKTKTSPKEQIYIDMSCSACPVEVTDGVWHPISPSEEPILPGPTSNSNVLDAKKQTSQETVGVVENVPEALASMLSNPKNTLKTARSISEENWDNQCYANAENVKNVTNEKLPNAATSSKKLRMGKRKLSEVIMQTDFSTRIYPSTAVVNSCGAVSQFNSYMLKHNIYNELMFNHFLRCDDSFYKLMQQLPLRIMKPLKEKCISINEARFKPLSYEDAVYRDKLELDCHEFGTNLAYYEGLLFAFLSTLFGSTSSIRESLIRIFDVLTGATHKKCALIFIGKSDTGKSFFANLLSSVYYPYEIGYVVTPAGTTVSDFWLSECVTCSLKRVEELCISTPIIAQSFKALFEGNTALTANRKYLSSTSITKTPIIVTMNGSSVYDICKYVSNEYTAISNRAEVFYFDKVDAFSKSMLKSLSKYGPFIVLMMYEKYLSFKNKHDNSTLNKSTFERMAYDWKFSL